MVKRCLLSVIYNSLLRDVCVGPDNLGYFKHFKEGIEMLNMFKTCLPAQPLH